MNKKTIYTLISLMMFIFLIQSISSAKTDSGTGYRSFFHGTIPLRTVSFEIIDYSCDENITFNIYYATKTEEWDVLNTKDLYIEIKITNQSNDSKAEVYIADCYFEELVVGGDLGGISFYGDGLSIGDNSLVSINETIPYYAHILLPGLDFITYGEDYRYRRKDGGAYGTQISMEIQLFVELDGKFFQDYLVDSFIINNGGSEATSYQPSVVTQTPGFEAIVMVVSLFVIGSIARRVKKRRK
ncbi:MAG: hypothetical protein ACTSP4_04915 [Candidatus Hodarchaeales archaeon]